MTDSPVSPTRPDGITVLAIWYLVLASGAAFGACVTMIPAGILSFARDIPTGGRFIASVLLGFGFTVTVLMFAACLTVAWGLWKLREWARIMALVLAIFHLPFFPVGTLIGGATLWYLTSHAEVQTAFSRPAP